MLQPASQVLDQNDLGRQRDRAAIPGALHRSSPARLAHRGRSRAPGGCCRRAARGSDCKLLARADAPGEPDAMEHRDRRWRGASAPRTAASCRCSTGQKRVEQSDAGTQQRFVGEQTIADCGLNVGREELQLGARPLLLALEGRACRDPSEHAAGEQDSEGEQRAGHAPERRHAAERMQPFAPTAHARRSIEHDSRKRTCEEVRRWVHSARERSRAAPSDY